MQDFLFFAVVYGIAISLSLLAIGSGWREAGIWLDRRMSPHLWPEPGMVDGEIRYPDSDNPRLQGGKIKVFVHCPACIAFWTAAIFSLAGYSPSVAHFNFTPLVSAAVDGLASTGIIWCMHVAMTKLGQYEQ